MKTNRISKKMMVILITFFFFTIGSIQVINASNITVLTVRTEFSKYYPGEKVEVTGTLKENGTGISGGDVCVTIKNPDGVEVFSICTMTGSTGFFSAEYTTESVYGSYSVKAETHTYNKIAYDFFEVVKKDVTAHTNGPYFGVIEQPIQFTGSVSGGKSPYDWSWVFGDETNTSSKQNPVFSFSKTGNYSLSLNVRDDGGFEDTSTSYVLITDELIAEPYGPYEAPPNTSIQFTGDGFGGYPPYTYQWDFGDGNTSTEQNPEYSYENFGEYSLTLTVIDSKQLNATATTMVTIATNIAPEKPEVAGSLEGKAGEMYNYTVTVTDPNGHDVYYKCDWGDGEVSEWLGPYTSDTQISFSHSWEEKGDYEIRVKAKDIYDLEGNWSDPLTVTMPKTKENNIIFDFVSFLQNLIRESRLIDLFPTLFLF